MWLRSASKLDIPEDRRVNQLTDDELLRIRELIDRENRSRATSAVKSDEHQAADGPGLRPRPAPPPGLPVAASAPTQRPHPQGQGGWRSPARRR